MEAILTHKVSETTPDSKHTVEGFVYDEPIKSEMINVHTIYKLFRNEQQVAILANPNKLDQETLIAECNKLLTQPKLFV